VKVFHKSPIVMPKAADIARFADNLLQSDIIPDYPNALNGLQIDTKANIGKIAAAVDFSARTVRGAIEAGANLLIVHHGAFWSGAGPLTGHRYEMLSELFARSLGVYSSHLPLDRHPTLGNNALLARRLSLVPESQFGQFQGISIGVAGHSTERVSGLMTKVQAFSSEHGGQAHSTAYSPDRSIGAWALCTGGGADASTLREAAERGIETLIVGEGPHWTAVHAEDHGIVLIHAGHYATETLGVQALAEAIAAEFRIEWEFIPAPTGT
jgi:dinuclear metal center YbgI/SA1388 family protein